MFFEMIACVLQQIAILHPAGTDGFTRSAAKAQIDMTHGGIAEDQAAFLNGAHEIDPPARRVILVAGFQIGWTGAEAQPAMNASERFAFIQETVGLWNGTWVHSAKRALSRRNERHLLARKARVARRTCPGTAFPIVVFI